MQFPKYDGFYLQGEDILENSCEKMKCGVVENLFGGKKEDVHLHLFDHQLIICKRVSKICTFYAFKKKMM